MKGGMLQLAFHVIVICIYFFAPLLPAPRMSTEQFAMEQQQQRASLMDMQVATHSTSATGGRDGNVHRLHHRSRARV